MKKENKNGDLGYTLVEIMAVIAVLFALSVIGAIIYIALHFIARYW